MFIVLLGLALRLRGLAQVGFNEDEVQKVVAAHSYLHGQFSVNLEHPMLMKSLIAISLAAGDIWNRDALIRWRKRRWFVCLTSYSDR